jgi:hypothetical protein
MGYVRIKRDRPSLLTQAISTLYPLTGNNFHPLESLPREHKGRGSAPPPMQIPNLIFKKPIPDTTSRPRGALRPSCAKIFHPMEGVGMPGAHCTRGLVCTLQLVESTRATTSTPEQPAFPHAMVLTAYFVLLCPQNLLECANGRFSPTARRWV